jgi:hypothetical protein
MNRILDCGLGHMGQVIGDSFVYLDGRQWKAVPEHRLESIPNGGSTIFAGFSGPFIELFNKAEASICGKCLALLRMQTSSVPT